MSLFLAHPSWAAGEFKDNNPDGKKYEFARSYISALSYFYNIEKRWKKKSPKKARAGNDAKIILDNISALVNDSADLRISKNYMTKYLDVNNALQRKVANIMVLACDRAVAINNVEKRLWQGWFDLKEAKQGTPTKEQALIKSVVGLGLQRKEAYKEIIIASRMMTRVIMSDKNVNETGHALAITTKERDKLLDKLDSFGKDTLDWGLKPGQTTLQASVATIREILEDPVWIAADKKP